MGRRFHHDSLGSHAFLHLRGSKKNPPILQKKKKKNPDPPSSTTPNTMTWACGAAKFNLEQVSEATGVKARGRVVTLCAAELPNRPSDGAAARLKTLFWTPRLIRSEVSETCRGHNRAESWKWWE